MPAKYKLAVFIGRFNMPHKGHISVIRQSLDRAERVLVLIGSADKPRDTRNPFLWEERKQMLDIAAHEAGLERDRIVYRPLHDVLYNDPAWIRQVQAAAFSELGGQAGGIALAGHTKDQSSYYLKLFPLWGEIACENYKGISSTDLRRNWLENEGQTRGLAPYTGENIATFLMAFGDTSEFKDLLAEHVWVQEKCIKPYEFAPHPVQFQTADAVVIQSGYILLVKRGAMPGKGQLALPGGYVNPLETKFEAAVRELREETRLKVPAPVLKGSLTSQGEFDYPYRSVRGRIVTTAFRFDLTPQTELPQVKGSSDADDALWLPLGGLTSKYMFEDHYDIIRALVGF